MSVTTWSRVTWWRIAGRIQFGGNALFLDSSVLTKIFPSSEVMLQWVEGGGGEGQLCYSWFQHASKTVWGLTVFAANSVIHSTSTSMHVTVRRSLTAEPSTLKTHSVTYIYIFSEMYYNIPRTEASSWQNICCVWYRYTHCLDVTVAFLWNMSLFMDSWSRRRWKSATC